MKRYLLDTNHIGETIGQVSIIRDLVQQLKRQGVVFGTCGPVLCELLAGVVQRKDEEKVRRRLDTLLEVVRVWPIDLTIAEHYAKVFHDLKNAGRALSQVGMILFAMTQDLSAILLTTDQDFQALPEVQTENWLAD